MSRTSLTLIKMSIIKLFTISILLSVGFCISAQQNFDFGFQYSDSIVVKDSIGNNLDFPWVGGLNSAHFQQVDLNLDGNLDLVAFEVNGNFVYTFVNKNIAGQAKYVYDPSYQKHFPMMMAWLQLVDYNFDGKNDLFTYYSGGISLYKNISTPATGLKFELVRKILYYDNPGPVDSSNLFVTEVDYPAITDIDDDGDVDIVEFYMGGAVLNYYENKSMDYFGDAEHISFELSQKCWGKFAESSISNVVYLNHFNCNYKSENENQVKSNKAKHTGGTLLVHDFNADGKKDLLLGDVDYLNINYLVNGATNDSAVFISQLTTYPASNPISVFSFPVVNYLDVDNDGIKELVAAPFDGTYFKAETKNNILLYENSGQNNSPVFNLLKNNFMQGGMIDVGDHAMPEFVDVDGDGLLDLVIGNYGLIDSSRFDTTIYILYTYKISSLAYFKNIGTATNPSFRFITSDWMGLRSLGHIALKPTFGDIDGDGDADMIVGNSLGTLTFFENTAGAGNQISFAPPIFNYKSIDVGNFSAPELFDVTGDSLLDLTIGTQVGDLAFYENVGSQGAASFSLVSSKMGNAEMYYYSYPYSAYSMPEFFRGTNDSLQLFVGSFGGFIYYFKDIESNLTGNFSLDSNIVYMDELDTLYSIMHFMNGGNLMEFARDGLMSAPLLHDFNLDGYPEMFVGNFNGGLRFYKGIEPQGVGVESVMTKQELGVNVFPVPSSDVIWITIDGKNIFFDFHVSIFDVRGTLLTEKQIDTRINSWLDISALVNGVYIAKIELVSPNKQVVTRNVKFVKL